MTTIGDIEAEIDSAVMARLGSDPAYRHAETAEDQTEREDEISREEATRVLAKYNIDLDDWLDSSSDLEIDHR